MKILCSLIFNSVFAINYTFVENLVTNTTQKKVFSTRQRCIYMACSRQRGECLSNSRLIPQRKWYFPLAYPLTIPFLKVLHKKMYLFLFGKHFSCLILLVNFPWVTWLVLGKRVLQVYIRAITSLLVPCTSDMALFSSADVGLGPI